MQIMVHLLFEYPIKSFDCSLERLVVPRGSLSVLESFFVLSRCLSMVSKVRVGFRGWFLYIRSALKGYESVI